MLSGVTNSNSAAYAQYASMINKLDTDSDGQVTKSEFVKGAPQGVSGDAAASLFDILDTQSAGAVKDNDLANAFAQLSAATQAMLIQTQSGGQGPLDAKDRGAELFSKLDTNGDGTLSRDEFVAGRPSQLSEDQANKLFDTISGANGDSLSQAQFVSGFEALHANGTAAAAKPHGHGHGGGGGGGGSDDDDSNSDDQTFDALDTNKDGYVSLEELLAGKPDDVSTDDATSFYNKISADSSDTGVTKDQFAQGMEDVRANKDGNSADGATDPRTLLKQMLATLEQTGGMTANGSSGQSMDQIMKAIDAYRTASLSGADAAAA